MMPGEAKRAAWFLGSVAIGQLGAIARTALALPALALGGIMLAIAWQPPEQYLSRLQANMTASYEASAAVVGRRFVCDEAAANQLALRGMEHVSRAEAGCRMRAEAVLRFVDREGKAHDVIASDPFGGFMFRAMTVAYRPDPFERAVPLTDPMVMVDIGAIAKLDQIVSGGAALIPELPQSVADWSQWQALRLRASDPLLFEALSWLGPARETQVALRYAGGAPERAWIVALLDSSDWDRVPWGVVLALGAIGVWLVVTACQIYFITWRRWSAGIAATVILLALPWWAERVFDLMEYFSARIELVAALREDFDFLGRSNARRVEPAGELVLEPVTATAAVEATQRAALEGLIPPRPQQTFANLGASYEALCTAAGERLLALPEAGRSEHLRALSKLLELGADGPTWCLMPAAIRMFDAADAGDSPRHDAYNLFILSAYANPDSGQIAGSYAAAHHLREQAQAALSRASKQREP
jgi:hypothetical protein